jgi:integrase
MTDYQKSIDNYVDKIEAGGEDLSNMGEPTDWRPITDNEQDALLTFHRKLAARSKPGPRRHRDVLGQNFRLARDLDIDITDGFEEERVAEQVVGYINSTYDSPETRRDYRRHYVLFGKYVTSGDEAPESMSFVNTAYDSGYDQTPDPSNMIRLDEMRTIADACLNTRDAALIALAWDSGARPNELYEMRYQDLREYKVGYQAYFRKSKTETRNVKPLIHSVEYLQKWLDNHPTPERDAPLWCDLTPDDGGNVERISQGYFARIFRDAMDRVDVDRPHQCRYYRKSMQAFLASKNVNEAHINIRAGRGPTSDKAKRYTSVFGDEHVSQVASAYGVEVDDSEEEDIEPIECPRCGKSCAHDAEFCWNCRQVLDYSAASELEEEEQRVRREVLSFAAENPELLDQIDGMEQMLTKLEENPDLLSDARKFAEALDAD